MSYILNLETATKNCSVAIAKDGKTILCKEMAEAGYSHAEKLHVFIEECLQELHLTSKDLSAVAVSQGPGSYTGLRIGVQNLRKNLIRLAIRNFKRQSKYNEHYF